MAETTENKGAEVTAESKEMAKAIAKIAYDKRGVFAYLVREVYGAVKTELEENTKADESLVKFFSEDPKDVANKIKENYPEVYDALYDIMYDSLYESMSKNIKENVLENLDVDDIDDSLKDEICDNYVRDNKDRIARDCFDDMSTYDQKDFIKDCIDDL